MISLHLNGEARTVDAEPETPLLWVIRDNLGMIGTKFGCGAALCGACTVHVDGEAIRSCTTPVSAVAGRKITTVEAMGTTDLGRRIQAAWAALDVPQCGYCQAGQMMSAAALLASKPAPTDADIDSAMAGNICRCGTYPRIRAAIHRAAGRDAAKGE
jgi:isoquinoline 1-oxidoreductase alpha subunit